MYLIHPMWFYVYGIVGNIAGLLLALSIACFGCALVFRLVASDYQSASDLYKQHIKTTKKFITTAIISAVICALIPSKETMLQMAVASYATSENISKLAANGKILKDELKTDFLDIIKTIKENKPESK